MLAVIAGWCIPASVGGLVLCHRHDGHVAIQPAHHICHHDETQRAAHEQAGMNDYGTCRHPRVCVDIPLEMTAKAPERSVRAAHTRTGASTPFAFTPGVAPGRCVIPAIGRCQGDRPAHASHLLQIRTVILLL